MTKFNVPDYEYDKAIAAEVYQNLMMESNAMVIRASAPPAPIVEPDKQSIFFRIRRFFNKLNKD